MQFAYLACPDPPVQLVPKEQKAKEAPRGKGEPMVKWATEEQEGLREREDPKDQQEQGAYRDSQAQREKKESRL